MKKLLLLVMWIGVCYAYGKDVKYPAAEIPQHLLVNSNVIIRDATTTFTILAKDEARYKVRRAVTILNEYGNGNAVEYVGYDKLSKVLSFEGSLYDANGEFVRKLKKSEIYDRSYVSGFSLYEDSRIQIADLQYSKYPYTVEFEYEVKYKYLFQIPTFRVFHAEKTSVQKSALTLIFPTSLAPRYKEINVNSVPEKNSDTSNGLQSVTWNFENITSLKSEPFGLSFEEIVPRIMVAPSNFEYEGYAGQMDSWNQFGKWIHTLNEGRSELDAQAQNKVKELVSGLSSTEEKIKTLYEYMQSRTRYVSISLGIGGFQPFDASVVDKTGYGDCKALSNYMVSLLKVAGIKAHYALIMAGDNVSPLQTDFTSSQFNHAIVAVPNEADTLWLECTSQTVPFGYMGSNTDDRYALLILDEGAKLVKTPVYDERVNSQSRSADVYLDIAGGATAKVITAYSGVQYENGNLNFFLNREDELKKWINKNTAIPSFELNRFAVKNNKDIIPTAILDLDLSIPRFATVSGKRIFITPNLMNKSSFLPEANEARKSDIIVKTGWTDFDTIRYHLPEQLYHEFIPEPVHIESVFGTYDAEYKMEAGLLVYNRKLTVLEGNFTPDKYAELTNFYQSIKKADAMKIVFLNKT